MQALLFDTTELEAKQAQLLEETQVVSDLVQQAIQENALTALNQTAYQKRYDSLVQRFDRAKIRLEEVTTEIQEKQTASANVGTFLKAFDQMPNALTEFSLESWHSMVDFATVYSIDDIRFTFKNGQEVQAWTHRRRNASPLDLIRRRGAFLFIQFSMFFSSNT